MKHNGDEPAHAVLGAAEWISLAAAPTFAAMAVLTADRPMCPARQCKMHRR
jgi:hypothetical protein